MHHNHNNGNKYINHLFLINNSGVEEVAVKRWKCFLKYSQVQSCCLWNPSSRLVVLLLLFIRGRRSDDDSRSCRILPITLYTADGWVADWSKQNKYFNYWQAPQCRKFLSFTFYYCGQWRKKEFHHHFKLKT